MSLMEVLVCNDRESLCGKREHLAELLYRSLLADEHDTDCDMAAVHSGLARAICALAGEDEEIKGRENEEEYIAIYLRAYWATLQRLQPECQIPDLKDPERERDEYNWLDNWCWTRDELPEREFKVLARCHGYLEAQKSYHLYLWWVEKKQQESVI